MVWPLSHVCILSRLDLLEFASTQPANSLAVQRTAAVRMALSVLWTAGVTSPSGRSSAGTPLFMRLRRQTLRTVLNSKARRAREIQIR
jgi:hypothetical protein